jgi:hypothetical protein
MWRYILATLLAVAGLVALFLIAYTAGAATKEREIRKEGLAGLRGAELLKEGAAMVDGILRPDHIGIEADYLMPATLSNMQSWLKSYNNWRESKR